ncbi:tyrosine-type recombinase/integrase [Microtetraspora fusca]|uniref:tyrosine-type recombinase/integrase n=1 Tax=Microtetraspora fusca TaxID=1997 RepID=UPI001FE10A6B|nr:tyrosine-type recombinase/integrase [Microtetraspora fusca]
MTQNVHYLSHRQPTGHRGDRSIPRTRLETLFTDPAHALREKVLWRLLYDTAARAEEILTLNVEDLDLEFRRARVVSKGGAIEYVHWATPTARILPRLLAGRGMVAPTAEPAELRLQQPTAPFWRIPAAPQKVSHGFSLERSKPHHERGASLRSGFSRGVSDFRTPQRLYVVDLL